MKQTHWVFVTGGVCSSLGKGIVASSVAAIWRSAGKKVSIMKLDPYLNVDPGTMSPFQHGEVFVLDDGSETDLDLGHYERFIDQSLSVHATVTTGKIYSQVLEDERAGTYLGRTIQVVPHITDAIRGRIETAAKETQAEVLVVEIGGTVGDIEGEPFGEVLRQMKQAYGARCLSLHVTLLPYLAASGELKTKPTQSSVREMRRLGIQPDFIFCRADTSIPKSILEKISYFCDVEPQDVIPAETVRSIYEIPRRFQRYALGERMAQKWGWKHLTFDLSRWEKLEKQITTSQKNPLLIGLAGKYNDLDDAYLSVNEALRAAGWAHQHQVELRWIDTEKLEAQDSAEWEKLSQVAGVVVPGGFGSRGIEGKIAVAKFCREQQKPYLGLCLGSQIMAIELARHELNLPRATSEEFVETLDQNTPLVVHIMEHQKKISHKGASMRLGAYECHLAAGTVAHQWYQKKKIQERHRHRYEFNNQFREALEKVGLVIAGTSPDGQLVEIVEIKDHPFMIGCQFHPELLSRPWKPHPLFSGFISQAIEQR